MAKYYLTNKAVADFADIWEYTFDNWSEQQADHYYGMLISSCEKIANDPNLGKNYEAIAPNLFGLKAQRHIIFYRILENNSIEITRILHERMDLKLRVTE